MRCLLVLAEVSEVLKVDFLSYVDVHVRHHQNVEEVPACFTADAIYKTHQGSSAERAGSLYL